MIYLLSILSIIFCLFIIKLEKNKLVLKILDRLIVIVKSQKKYNSKEYQAIIRMCAKLDIEVVDFSCLNDLLVPSKSELKIMNYYELSEYYTTLFKYYDPKQIEDYFTNIKSLISITLLNKIPSNLENIFILYNTNKFKDFKFIPSSSTLRYYKVNNSKVLQLLPLTCNNKIIKLMDKQVDYIVIYTDIFNINHELILFLFNNISYIDLDYLIL